MKINRRHFVRSAAYGVAGAMVARLPRAVAAERSHIDILFEEPIGVISEDLYGYLVENLGAQIYDGIWVGEKSKISNIGAFAGR
jgi:alpha-L-arabinofuranosidase